MHVSPADRPVADVPAEQSAVADVTTSEAVIGDLIAPDMKHCV